LSNQNSSQQSGYLSLATLEIVHKKISMMNVHLHCIFRNWKGSGQGGGGIDVDNDADKVSFFGNEVEERVKKSEFRQLKNCCCGALNTRVAFLGTYQPYLLYYWEMLDKYQLFSTSFSELNRKILAKTGGKGVPLVIDLMESSEDAEHVDFSDVRSLMGSLKKPSVKNSSLSSKKSRSKDGDSKKPMKFNGIFIFKGLEQLAQSNIIASRMDMSATMCTNILLMKAEYQGLDMAMIEDPPPKEEQINMIETELGKLKSELNNMVATPSQNNLHMSLRHADDSI
jgi:hypothetical protein